MAKDSHTKLQPLIKVVNSPYFLKFMSDDILTAQIHAWLETETIKATPHSWCFGMVDLTVDSKGMLSPDQFEISVLEEDWNDWHYRAVATEMREAIREQALQFSTPIPNWRSEWNRNLISNLKNQIHYFLHPYGLAVLDAAPPLQESVKSRRFPIIDHEMKEPVGYLCIKPTDGHRACCYSTDLKGEPVTHTYLVGGDVPAEITSKNPKSAYRDPIKPSLNAKLERAAQRISWTSAPHMDHDRDGPLPF